MVKLLFGDNLIEFYLEIGYPKAPERISITIVHTVTGKNAVAFSLVLERIIANYFKDVGILDQWSYSPFIIDGERTLILEIDTLRKASTL